MLVGESGVGKSTLTNALLGNSKQITRELSEATGRRQTHYGVIRLVRFAGGRRLMDSPGVRDYAPAPVSGPASRVRLA